MNFQALERHLIRLGQQELEVRAVFEKPNTPPYQRQQSLDLLGKMIGHVHTILLTLEILTGTREKSAYYKEFYDQARSKKGLTQGRK